MIESVHQERETMPGEDLTDEELFSRYLATRDTDSLGILYQRLQKVLFTHINSKLQNVHDAQDVLQEISLFLLQQAPSKYDARWPLLPWLLGVANMYVLRFERWRQRKGLKRMAELARQKMDVDGMYGAQSPLELVLRREQNEIVARAIDTLAPKLAATVRAVVLNGMSYREAGDMMGIAELAVAQRLSRARIKLRMLLKERQHPDALPIQ